MSDNRNILACHLDATAQARKEVVSETLVDPDATQKQSLYYGTQAIFRATVYASAYTIPYNFPTSSITYLFGIDNTPAADHPDLVLTNNQSDFNQVADWSNVSPAAGKICWRANLATPNLKNALNALPATTLFQLMYCNLWIETTIGHTLIASWPIYIYRVHVDPVTAKAVDTIQHPTIEQCNASYVPMCGDASAWRFTIAKGWQYRFQEDGKWRSLLPKLDGDVPMIGWGEPED